MTEFIQHYNKKLLRLIARELHFRQDYQPVCETCNNVLLWHPQVDSNDDSKSVLEHAGYMYCMQCNTYFEDIYSTPIASALETICNLPEYTILCNQANNDWRCYFRGISDSIKNSKEEKVDDEKNELIAALSQEHDECIKLLCERKKLQEKYKEATKKINLLEVQKAYEMTKKTDNLSEVIRLQLQNDELKKKINTQATQLNDIEFEVIQLNSHIDDLQNDLHQKDSLLKENNLEITAAHNDCFYFDTEMVKYKNKFTKANKKYKACEKKVEAYEKKVEECQKELTILKEYNEYNKITDLNDELVNLTEDNILLKKTNKDLQEKITLSNKDKKLDAAGSLVIMAKNLKIKEQESIIYELMSNLQEFEKEIKNDNKTIQQLIEQINLYEKTEIENKETISKLGIQYQESISSFNGFTDKLFGIFNYTDDESDSYTTSRDKFIDYIKNKTEEFENVKMEIVDIEDSEPSSLNTNEEIDFHSISDTESNNKYDYEEPADTIEIISEDEDDEYEKINDIESDLPEGQDNSTIKDDPETLRKLKETNKDTPPTPTKSTTPDADQFFNIEDREAENEERPSYRSFAIPTDMQQSTSFSDEFFDIDGPPVYRSLSFMPATPVPTMDAGLISGCADAQLDTSSKK